MSSLGWGLEVRLRVLCRHRVGAALSMRDPVNVNVDNVV